MSNLTPREQSLLCKLFRMESDNVFGFTDITFSLFFGEKFNIDINDKRYERTGTSQGARLKEFWRIKSNEIVANSIYQLTDHLIDADEKDKRDHCWYPGYNNDDDNQKQLDLIRQCKQVAARLYSGSTSDELKKLKQKFDSRQYIADQITRMDKAINEHDYDLAIGTAKELIETICKTISVELGEPESKLNQLQLEQLVTSVLEKLNLTSAVVTEATKGRATIMKLLKNLRTIAIAMAELRNLYGTGHGKTATTKGLSQRHAKLAVGSASVFVTFIYETYKEMT